MSLLGRGCGDALPTLGGVRSRYAHEANGERLYRLCCALVEKNLADDALWRESGERAAVFVQTAVSRVIDKICGSALKDAITYVCEIRDDMGSGYWRGEAVGEGELAAMVDTQCCGYLIIGAAISALEEQERFLGASFYLLLCRSLYRWMRIYTHSDAEIYIEDLREWRDQDDPENQESYEFPPVDEAIPECVQALEKADGWTPAGARVLLRRHLHGPHSAWIQKLLTIHRLSQCKRSFVRFEGQYDSPPIPSTLIVFRRNDAVEACFDHESDRYGEADNEPACGVCFRPDDPEQVDSALRTMAIFLRINRELSELIKLLNDWNDRNDRNGREERDASQHQHRTDAPIPTH